MLYSEFVQGTGCVENDHNFKVYKDLEVMYSNSTLSKQEIYEYGKKLVDNTPSQATLDLIAGIKEQINTHSELIRGYKKDIAFQKYLCEGASVDELKERKATIKRYRQLIKQEQNVIASLKWVLG